MDRPTAQQRHRSVEPGRHVSHCCERLSCHVLAVGTTEVVLINQLYQGSPHSCNSYTNYTGEYRLYKLLMLAILVLPTIPVNIQLATRVNQWMPTGSSSAPPAKRRSSANPSALPGQFAAERPFRAAIFHAAFLTTQGPRIAACHM